MSLEEVNPPDNGDQEAPGGEELELLGPDQEPVNLGAWRIVIPRLCQVSVRGFAFGAGKSLNEDTR